MEKLRIFCENNNGYMSCDYGSTLNEVLKGFESWPEERPLAAIVDNQLKELDFKLFMPHKVRFIGISHPDGNRTYYRSLCFLLQRALVSLLPGYSLVINYNLPNGPYAEVQDQEGYVLVLKPVQIESLKVIMKGLVERNLPIIKSKMNSLDAEAIFKANGQKEKARLVELGGRFFTTVYSLDGYTDTFYGPLVPSTGLLEVFDLVQYKDGMFLVLPDRNMKLPELKNQDKLYEVFKEDARWVSIIGVRSISSITECILSENTHRMIQIAEALHERRYADIADMIYAGRNNIRLVLIAGPSSSGKTTTSKRIALQCRVLGLNPKVIEMDNYFVDRERTPRDESGEYDFEHIEAMDLEFLNMQLRMLMSGEEIDVPKFDFVEGKRFFDGEKMKLEEDDILIMEGIHGLNPRLTSSVPDVNKFKIYASALTSLSIDENNTISTSDNRLLRRIVRDNNFRGVSAENTILRWASVRRGETENIFPYQENADAMFNSSLIFELPMLKYYAEPLLRRIAPNSPAYTEVIRLLKFLNFYPALKPQEIEMIPPTSVMREFIGGARW